MQITIRPMTPEDAAPVLHIYTEGILSGSATFRTDIPDWDEFTLTHHHACRLVAEDSRGAVVGWTALMPVSMRACYRGVAELSIYIDSSCRKRGIGKLLLTRLITESEAAGFWTLQSTIIADNQASIRLHEACGFRAVGRRERIAQDIRGIWRDTYLMERRSGKVS